MQNKIIIFGATSAIAQEIAQIYALQGAQFFLVARNEAHLKSICNDLIVRGAARAEYRAADLSQLSEHADLIQQAIETMGTIDLALFAHGTLSDQTQAETSVAYLLQEMNLNLMSTLSLLTIISPYFERQKQGCIAVLSSVAGERGRQSNYVYGTAKAGLSVFLQGLRNRLHASNVHVITIKPGFVDTPMTQAFKKNFLWSKPDIVAKHITQSIEKKRCVIYTPRFWRYIMLVIKCIPERIFCRLPL